MTRYDTSSLEMGDFFSLDPRDFDEDFLAATTYPSLIPLDGISVPSPPASEPPSEYALVGLQLLRAEEHNTLLSSWQRLAAVDLDNERVQCVVLWWLRLATVMVVIGVAIAVTMGVLGLFAV